MIESLYNDLYELKDLINKTFGYMTYSKLPRYRDAGCQASHDGDIVVLPSGKFTCCEHHIDDEFIGSIYEKSLDISKISKFRHRQEKIEGRCENCPIYPICYITKGCGMLSGCNDKLKEKKMNKIYDTLKYTLLKSTK